MLDAAAGEALPPDAAAATAGPVEGGPLPLAARAPPPSSRAGMGLQQPGPLEQSLVAVHAG